MSPEKRGPASKTTPEKPTPEKPTPENVTAKATSPKKATAQKPGAQKPTAKATVAPKTSAEKPSAQKPTAKATATEKAEEQAASAPGSQFFARAQQRARRVLRDKDELMGLVRKADKVGQKLKSGPMSQLVEELKALLRLIRAYANGEYRNVSRESMVLIVAAVIYVVSPIDLIPDFIPVAGLLDDVAVLSFAVKRLRVEIDDFLEWEKGQVT